MPPSTLEDMVKTINETSDVFALGGDMQVFRDGLSDLLARLQKLEAMDKSKITEGS